MGKVRLFDEHRYQNGEEGKVLGLVDYTTNLDHWDGHNMTSGSMGRHLGLSKCKKGYYVCYGSQWEGERDYAELIAEDEAKELCLKHNPGVYKDIFGEEPPDLM
jgi:hypothetical protein